MIINVDAVAMYTENHKLQLRPSSGKDVPTQRALVGQVVQF